MGERQYYICSSLYCGHEDWYEDWYSEKAKERKVLTVKYEVPAQMKEYKKFLWVWYEHRFTGVKTKVRGIPLFLYGEGEETFEFFTKRYFGKIERNRKNSNPRSGYVFIPNRLVETEERCHEEWGPDTWWPLVRECSPSEFLEEVNKIKEELHPLGIDEQNLVAQINAIFDEHENKSKKEIAEREAEMARAKAEAERKKQQDEIAKKALDDMLS